MAEIKDDILPGKTARLLNRLPHFFRPEALGKDFLNLFKVLGTSLEANEQDLFDVLKAHHIQTAGNAGSKGFMAPAAEHGDLDNLFALYLESLGGTSQLVSMNPLFTVQSFAEERLLATLYETEEEWSVRLKEWLLTTETAATDRLVHYLPASCAFLPEEINGELVFAILMAKNDFTRYLLDQLEPATQTLLFQYDGKGHVAKALAEALAEDLNEKVLKDPFLYRNHFEYFEELQLPPKVITLRNVLNKKYLTQRYTEQYETDPGAFGHQKANLLRVLKELEFAPKPSSPPMHDIIRLNRMLIDQAGQLPTSPGGPPWITTPKDVPSRKETRALLQIRFNALLNSENAAPFFEELLENHRDGKDLQRQYADNPLMLRRFLLESILPYEIAHIYRSYQNRLQALINVLRQGASTKQGIKDIIAANFGMIGEDPETLQAKELIRIIEFDPEPTTYVLQEVALYQSFSLYNPNQDPAIPEVRITMLSSSIQSIRNLRFIETHSGNKFTVPVEMKAGDSFELNAEELIVNGVLSGKEISGTIHSIPSREPVAWTIDAEILSHNTNEYGIYGNFDDRPYDDDTVT